MDQSFRHYLTVTGGYWAFTITDGAIRMLVVLYFHQLGYSPLEIAMLFLFYELFGIITNLLGGWLGSRIGLNLTMQIGMLMQIGALLMLTVPDAMLTTAYVMAAQAISGIAKDLNKMSAKAGVKLFIPASDDARLFRWVALLTGSKNALKGGGFFVGGALLGWVGFRDALLVLAAMLSLALLTTWMLLPTGLGIGNKKSPMRALFAKSAAINWLSAARFFLFGARDIWFVVALPLFLATELGWDVAEVGAFFALWVIGYGMVQASAPTLFRNQAPDASALTIWALLLALVPALIAWLLGENLPAATIVVGGLTLFGLLFAINSALHSYLILHYSDHEKVSLNVGFYYMANAGGRLTGTLLSGLLYQQQGLTGCLYFSALFLVVAALLTLKLPATKATPAG